MHHSQDFNDNVQHCVFVEVVRADCGVRVSTFVRERQGITPKGVRTTLGCKP